MPFGYVDKQCNYTFGLLVSMKKSTLPLCFPLLDGVVMLWDIESGHPVQKYTGHVGSVNGLSFHPSDALCSSVSGDTSIHLWTYTATAHLRQRNSSNPLDR